MSNVNAFVDDGSPLKIELFYRRSSKGNAMHILRSLKDVKEERRSEYSKITFLMRPMTWGFYNELQQVATVDVGMPTERIDWTVYKQQKVMRSLTGWDILDKDNNPVPVTPENIFKLHPVMVETLLSSYDEYSFVGEAETKKS